MGNCGTNQDKKKRQKAKAQTEETALQPEAILENSNPNPAENNSKNKFEINPENPNLNKEQNQEREPSLENTEINHTQNPQPEQKPEQIQELSTMQVHIEEQQDNQKSEIQDKNNHETNGTVINNPKPEADIVNPDDINLQVFQNQESQGQIPNPAQSVRCYELCCVNCKRIAIHIKEFFFNVKLNKYIIKYKCSCNTAKLMEAQIETLIILTSRNSHPQCVEPCIFHPTENWIYYCSTCKIDICLQCQMSHQNHKIKDIKQLNANYFDMNITDDNLDKMFHALEKHKMKFEVEFNAYKTEINNKISDNKTMDNKIALQNEYNNYIDAFYYEQALLFNFLEWIYLMKKSECTYSPRFLNWIKFFKISTIINNEEAIIKIQKGEGFISDDTKEMIENTEDRPNLKWILPFLSDKKIGNTKPENPVYSEVNAESSRLNRPPIKLQATLTGHTDKIITITQLLNNNLASGSYDSTIRIWDLTRFCLWETIEENGKVLSWWQMEPNFILSGTTENSIQLIDLTLKKSIYRYSGHSLWVNALVRVNHTFFASASNDSNIAIWDYYTKKCLHILKGHTDCIFSLALLKNQRLCSGSADKTVRIWNWETGENTHTLTNSNVIKCVTQINSGFIVTGSDDKMIKMWTEHGLNTSISGHNHSVRTICEENDSRFWSGSFDNSIKIWDSSSFKCEQTLTEHRANVISIIKLTDGRMVSCSNDKTLKIWA